MYQTAKMVKKVKPPPYHKLKSHTDVQSEQMKRDKLSALKKWSHFDPFESESFDGIADTLLHGIIWTEWDSVKFDAPAVIDAESDEDDLDGVDSAHSDDEVDVRGHTRATEGSSRSGSTASKKSTESTKKVSRRKTKVDISGGLDVKRKYDLGSIAKSGRGGKVMYVFEKVSKSKMLPKE
jgi:DNA repair and recombination protein RAD54B